MKRSIAKGAAALILLIQATSILSDENPFQSVIDFQIKQCESGNTRACQVMVDAYTEGRMELPKNPVLAAKYSEMAQLDGNSSINTSGKRSKQLPELAFSGNYSQLSCYELKSQFIGPHSTSQKPQFLGWSKALEASLVLCDISDRSKREYLGYRPFWQSMYVLLNADLPINFSLNQQNAFSWVAQRVRSIEYKPNLHNDNAIEGAIKQSYLDDTPFRVSESQAFNGVAYHRGLLLISWKWLQEPDRVLAARQLLTAIKNPTRISLDIDPYRIERACGVATQEIQFAWDIDSDLDKLQCPSKICSLCTAFYHLRQQKRFASKHPLREENSAQRTFFRRIGGKYKTFTDLVEKEVDVLQYKSTASGYGLGHSTLATAGISNGRCVMTIYDHFFNVHPFDQALTLVHEARHCMANDPGHVTCRSGHKGGMERGCDESFRLDWSGGAYNYGLLYALYLLEVIGYNRFDPEVMRKIIKELASVNFNQFPTEVYEQLLDFLWDPTLD